MKNSIQKPALILIATLALLLSCNKERNMFSLSGNIDGLDNDTIFVVGFDSRFRYIDTIFSKNGHFIYSTPIDTITPIFLFYKKHKTEDFLFADKGLNTQINGDIRDVRRKVTGGELNHLLYQFFDSVKNDTSTLMTLERVETFIVENPFSEINVYLLFNYSLRDSIFNVDLVSKLINKMGGTIQDNTFISEIMQLTILPSRPDIFLPEHILFDTIGDKYSFSSLITEGHGLICFWSSWDMGSRKKMKELEVLSKKYDNHILKTIGISIDTEKERWRNAILNDNYDLSQLCDFQGWDGKFISTLKLKEIPIFVIVNPQNRVILMSRSITEIDQKLNSILLKKNTK
ncbi:MAG TPA: DUF4369 domain-containing protein [Bacteroidaceae bacterium]|nr:DUF4369 domain-containing protein [Bacteroidaceae bacterium]